MSEVDCVTRQAGFVALHDFPIAIDIAAYDCGDDVLVGWFALCCAHL